MRHVVVALFLLSALVGGAPAVADEPPPDCYEETCTLDVVPASGGNCRSCSAGPVVDEACAAQSMGFERVCSGWGASVYTEIWCEPDSGFTQPPDPNAACNGSGGDSGGGCHVSPAGAGGSGALMLLLAGLGVVFVRRFGRTSQA